MPKRKKTRKNTRKGRKAARLNTWLGRLVMGFKLTSAMAAVMLVTGLFILGYDLSAGGPVHRDGLNSECEQ